MSKLSLTANQNKNFRQTNENIEKLRSLKLKFFFNIAQNFLIFILTSFIKASYFLIEITFNNLNY